MKLCGQDKRNNIAFIQKPGETSPRILLSDMEPMTTTTKILN